MTRLCKNAPIVRTLSPSAALSLRRYIDVFPHNLVQNPPFSGGDEKSPFSLRKLYQNWQCE